MLPMLFVGATTHGAREGLVLLRRDGCLHAAYLACCMLSSPAPASPSSCFSLCPVPAWLASKPGAQGSGLASAARMRARSRRHNWDPPDNLQWDAPPRRASEGTLAGRPYQPKAALDELPDTEQARRVLHDEGRHRQSKAMHMCLCLPGYAHYAVCGLYCHAGVL